MTSIVIALLICITVIIIALIISSLIMDMQEQKLNYERPYTYTVHVKDDKKNKKKKEVTTEDNKYDGIWLDYININDIRIPKRYTQPNEEKLKKRLEYYEQHNTFEQPIILNKHNYVIDGYTSYLVAKEKKLDFVPVVIKEK